ncbi:MAG TPA: DUF4012 domain-containing protein [Actinoplanes sp.]
MINVLRPRRRPGWPVIVALTLVLTGSTATAWGATRVLSSRDHLQQAATLIRQLHSQLRQVDPAAAQTLAQLQGETRAARADGNDPIWQAGTHLPAAGDDLAAIRTVTTAMDDLARHGLPAFVATAGLLGTGAILPTSGRADLASLKHAAPRLAEADTAVRRVAESVDAIAVDGLTAPVRTAVVGLQAELHRAARTAGLAAKTAQLLPSMLGVDGPRTHLVLLQNLAEVRATGGMPGAFIVLRADRGKITISDQGTASGLGEFAAPVLALAPAERDLYTDKPAIFPADINLTPHFPTTGALAREMYRRRSGVTVDGVFATDPVALSYVLAALGPVPVPGGEPLTAATAVSLLLSRIYADGVSPKRQDDYFAAAARATFQALVSRPLRPSTLLGALAKAAGERRLLVWSTRPDENAILADTVLAGVLPASDGVDPTVGVFLNDGSGSKLGYYLTHRVELAVTPACRSDGRRELSLRVTLGSTAPESGLSPSVLGLGLAGHPYTLRTVIALYSPTGGSIGTLQLDRVERPFGSGRDRRRAVGVVTVDLQPGSERTLDVTMLTGVPRGGYGGTVTPRLRTTPGVAPWPKLVVSGTGCSTTR